VTAIRRFIAQHTVLFVAYLEADPMRSSRRGTRIATYSNSLRTNRPASCGCVRAANGRMVKP